MKKRLSSAMSILLAAVMLLMSVPFSVSAASDDQMIISASTKNAVPGQTVDIDISMINNPGISSVGLSVAYDSDILTIENITFNPEIGGSTQASQYTRNPAKIIWISPTSNYTNDAVLATFTFRVNADIQDNIATDIELSYDPDDIYDIDENNIECLLENGKVNVVASEPGDINGDGKVNNKDATRLMQFLSAWDVFVNEPCLDTNGDGKVNNKDATRLMQFLAGWDVELHVGEKTVTVCTHSLSKTEASAPSCEADGNIAFWYCSKCGKYFADANAVREIKQEDTVIDATGHTIVVDEAVPATYTNTGLTEGSHCITCGKVIIEQEVTPKLVSNTANITYKLVNNDSYLSMQTIDNPNPNVYTVGEELVLSNDLSVPGYTFIGWFDSFASNATQIKSILSNEKRDITLYAHWETYKYKIQYESDLIPVDDDYYTVNQSKALPTPKISGYSFVGWSDENGNIIKRIPIGTIGDKTYTANWLSDRNQAFTYKNVDEPIILEEDNKILFTYEIGEIRNVPISVIHDFGKIVGGGVASEQTVTHSKTVSDSEIKNYAKTVANATTENYGITLSNGWSDGMTVSEEYCKQNGLTQEEAQSLATNESNNWYVSSGKSGSSTTTTFNTTDTTDMKTGTQNNSGTASASQEGSKSSTHTEESHKDFGFEESVSASGRIGPVKVSGELSANQSFGDSKSDSTTESSKNALSASATVSSGTEHQGGTVTHTGSNSTSTGSWNSESGRGGSKSVTNTVSTSKIISELISEKTGYGKSFIKTGSETSNQGFSSEQSTSDSYSTGITYSTSESDSFTETISTTNTIEGYHRWVWATTAHVFMIVGYDIATSSYFTCNYSIMDADNVKRFEDYSYNTASYDDNQTSVISFEIPTDIKDYVSDRIAGSKGLQYSRDGKVTGYSGTDDFVIIPEYKVINGTVIKVTGIAENAFKGKVKLQNGSDEFLGIELSEFITEIEPSTFAGCSSLKYIDLKNVTSIGSNAFSGCSSLKTTKLNDNITYLGENAFENLDALLVYASNKSVAEATVNSGAKSIALIISEKCNDLEDVDLEVPESTEFFGFYGSRTAPRTFNNVRIVSHADETLILNANFVSTQKTPVAISSDTVLWGESSVTAPYFCLVFTAENTNLSIYGESEFSSQKGDAILTKNLSINNVDDELYSRFIMNGNVLLYGEVTGSEYLSFNSGQILHITEEEYARFLNGVFNVRFDPNGGSVETESKTVYYGSEYGELPTATRDYYTFDGWYTDPNSGNQVTENTIFEQSEDVSLYAHWTKNTSSDWVPAIEVPDDAEIVAEKWTYKQKETTSSGSSSMDGWVKYDTQITSYGPEQGPVYYDPSNGVRQVRSESYWIRDNYKTVWHYSRSISGPSGWNSYNVNISPSWGYLAYSQEIVLEDWERLGCTDSNWKGLGPRYGKYYYGGFDCPYWFNEWSESVYVNSDYGTRWYYRDPVYTYYYYRYVDKESTTIIEPSSTISGIVHWVKYVPKHTNEFAPQEFDALIMHKESQKPIESHDGNIIVGTENRSIGRYQTWHFTRFSDGSYKITSHADEKVIDLEGLSTVSGANIMVHDSNDGDNQRWYLQEYNGGYNIVPKCSPIGVMDLTNGKTDDFTNVQFCHYNGSSAQTFSIRMIPDLEAYLAGTE